MQQHGHVKATRAFLRGMQVGSLIDMHQYVGPNAPLPTLTRAAVLGEFGGLGLRLEGHQLVPEDSFSYQEMHSPAELEVSPMWHDRLAASLMDRHGRGAFKAVHNTRLYSALTKETTQG